MADRVPGARSLLKVKPDSNWTRPSGTTVFAGVNVGRSVLIGPSGSSFCEKIAKNRSTMSLSFGGVVEVESSAAVSWAWAP